MSGIVGLCGKSMLNFVDYCQTDFQSGCVFTFPSATCESSRHSKFSPVGVVSIGSFSRFNRSVVVVLLFLDHMTNHFDHFFPGAYLPSISLLG